MSDEVLISSSATTEISSGFFFFSSRRRHTRYWRDWSSDVCSSDLLAGLRPVIVHQRLDFMVYSLDAITNWMALWRFKSNGHSSMPVTIRAIVGKGWGQGPQHSKSLHAWVAHLPGIRVAVPPTAGDPKS